MIDISVVIVNYNVKAFLRLCLQSVSKALKSVIGEIIVVDNASTDASCQMVKTFFPEVVLIENKENIGFSKANNQGVEIAQGEYVLILNPDTVIPEQTFTHLINFHQKYDNIGAIGIALYDGRGHFLPESKRNIPFPKVSLKKLLGLKKAYYAKLDEHETGKVEVLVGAFMFLKRSTYQTVQGFDERYFMYGEDIDLSYTLILNGYDNYYLTNVQAIHFKGESTVKDNLYLNRFYGAMQLFYDKHLTKNTFSNALVSTGIKIWQTYNNLKPTKAKALNESCSKFLYIGSETKIFEALQKLYQPAEAYLYAVCETRVISKFDDLIRITEQIKAHDIEHLIFDAQNNSFDNIIFYMTGLSLKFSKLTFEIRPAGSTYLIGSLDKNTLGTVKQLSFS